MKACRFSPILSFPHQGGRDLTSLVRSPGGEGHRRRGQISCRTVLTFPHQWAGIFTYAVSVEGEGNAGVEVGQASGLQAPSQMWVKLISKRGEE